MRNTESVFKNYKWRLFDYCRGLGMTESTSVDAFVYSLFIKFLSDNKEELMLEFEEKYTIGYLELVYGKMVTKDEIYNHMSQMEKQLGVTENLLISGLRQWLDFMEEEKVIPIFNMVNEYGVLRREDFGIEFIRILSETLLVIRSQGVVTTPICIAKLEKELLDCQEGMEIYDATCGSGISVNICADRKANIYAQDIFQASASYTTIVSILIGNRATVKCGNSLINPILSAKDKKFDRIVSEPPLNYKNNDDIKMYKPVEFIYDDAIKGDMIYIRHLLARLKENGVCVVLVPMGWLFKSGKQGEIRSKLINDKYIDTVIELPNGILSPYTNISTALLVLKNNKIDSNILMIDTSRDGITQFGYKDSKSGVGFTDDGIFKISEIYRNREEQEGISRLVFIKEIEENQYNLCTLQYLVNTAEQLIEVKDINDINNKVEQLKEEYLKLDEELNIIRKNLI